MNVSQTNMNVTSKKSWGAKTNTNTKCKNKTIKKYKYNKQIQIQIQMNTQIRKNLVSCAPAGDRVLAQIDKCIY